MFLCEVGVSERDRRGWKLGSPPVLVQPGVPASRLDGDSMSTSSGSGGAPGSPGRGRLDVGVEGEVMLAPATEASSPPLCNEGRVSELATSEDDGLCSPSGWKSRVELREKELGRSLVKVGVLRVVSLEELDFSALRDSIFSFFAFCTSSVILVMMKFCERISRMESTRMSSPRGFSARMSSSRPVLLDCVVLQLMSSASSRVSILRERRKSR